MKSLIRNFLIVLVLLAPAGASAAPEKNASKEEIVRVLMEAGDRYSEGEYDSALKLYKQLTTIAPTNREGHLGMGRIMLLRGDNKQALNYFKEAVRLSPQSAPAHFELGSTHLNLGNLNDALKELTLAYDLDPSRPEIQYRLSQARSLVESSRLMPGQTSIKWPGRRPGFGQGETPPGSPPGSQPGETTGTVPGSTLPVTPPVTPPSDTVASTEPGIVMPTNIDQSSEVSLVYRLITSGRVEETMAQGLAALKKQPDNASLRYQIGLMYKVTGDIDKAIETFEESLKYDPEHTHSLAQLTALFISRNEMEKARDAANRWVNVDADNPNAHFSLAWTFIVNRSFKDALPHLKSAAQLDPRNTDLLNHLGLVLREMGNDHDASTYFERAIALTPNLAAPRLNMAMIELYDQRSANARELLKPLLEQTAVTPHVRSVDALIDARDGQLDSAQKKASDVLKTVPSNAIASLALAVVARENGQYDHSATILEGVLKNHQRNALVLHGLAEVYLAQGKTALAIEYAQKAHDRSPNKFLIAKTLALALASANNTVVALDTIKKMRELGDDPEKLFLLEAAILEAADDREAALKHYLTILEQQPNNNDVAMKVAHLYNIDRKFKQAQAIVTGILSHAPDNYPARLLQASILYELKDYKGALKQAQQIPEDDDLVFDINCVSARSSFKLKRYPEAAELFKIAKSKKQLGTDDMLMLARALKESDKAGEANEVLAQIKKVKFQSKELKAELRRLGRVSQ